MTHDDASQIWNPADAGFPRRYGDTDTLGAANEIGEDTVRAAAALIAGP